MRAPRGEGVHARIVYWGVPGAGVSTSLRHIHAKLRPDHRGDLESFPTRLDPTVSYELLRIELGEIAGVDTRFEIVGIPADPEHGPTRKQLLDRADGLVFVADARRERADDTLASFEELRRTLRAYGRALEAVPLVIQLNQRDRADAVAVEDLVRKLALPRASVFETVAVRGSGVLSVLSTITKQVVRSLREQPARAARPDAASEVAVPEPAPAARPVVPEPAPILPEETLTRALSAPAVALHAEPPPAPPGYGPLAAEEVTGRLEDLPDLDLSGAAPSGAAAPLRLVDAGPAAQEADGSVRLPLVLADGAGRRFRLAVRIALESAAAGEEAPDSEAL